MSTSPTDGKPKNEDAKKSSDTADWSKDLKMDPPSAIYAEIYDRLKSKRKAFSSLNMPALHWVNWTIEELLFTRMCLDFVPNLLKVVEQRIGWGATSSDNLFWLDRYSIEYSPMFEKGSRRVIGFHTTHHAIRTSDSFSEYLSNKLRRRHRVVAFEIDAYISRGSDVRVVLTPHLRGFADLALRLKESISELSGSSVAPGYSPIMPGNFDRLDILRAVEREIAPRWKFWSQTSRKSRKELRGFVEHVQDLEERETFERLGPMMGTINWNYGVKICEAYDNPWEYAA